MEGTVAGKHSYLLCVLSHKGKWETAIFTNILLQLWGALSGLLWWWCSISHKCLKLFPIYDSSLFPLISSLTFFNLKHLSHFESPNSYLHVCPAQSRLSSLACRLPWTPEPALESLCQRQPSPGMQQPCHAQVPHKVIFKPQNWNRSSALTQGRKDLDTAAKCEKTVQ